MAPKRRPPVDRFVEKTRVTPSGCVEWVASRNNRGYGTFTVASHRTVMAHRWAYEYHVGPIPPGLDLDHLCRNRACVNPAHLEPVSTSENLRRGVDVGRFNSTKTHCPEGHPYEGDNLYIPPGRMNRLCRACRRSAKRKRKERAA